MSSGKETRFEEYKQSKPSIFKCKDCPRRFTSKRSVLLHLEKTHKLSPVKRKCKKYIDDPSIPVPNRTKYRWRQKEKQVQAKKMNRNKYENDTLGKSALMDLSDLDSDSDSTQLNFNESVLKPVGTSEFTSQYQEIFMTENYSEGNTSGLYEVPLNTDVRESLSVSDTHSLNGDESGDSSFIQTSELSSISSTSEIDTYSSDSDDSESEISPLSGSITSDSSNSDYSDAENTCLNNSEHQHQALTILSVFLRHNLSGSASKDILSMMKQLFPASESLKELTYESIWKYCNKSTFKEYHYCELCFNIFPDNVTVYHCTGRNCNGLRFVGNEAHQMSTKKPRKMFVIGDVAKQLVSLMKNSDILEYIKSTKRNLNTSENKICDITDGKVYQSLIKSGFLTSDNLNITGLCNTDGIALYSSSHIELWPIFLVINELPPKIRFQRQNMLLVGMWQGRGKPPFCQYMDKFKDEMNKLRVEGVDLEKPTNGNMKLAVICCTFDLPAKAGVMNMTYFNGANACITCEEPGYVARQGKGHARCFPYRSANDKYSIRTSENILRNMETSTKLKRSQGFCGPSSVKDLIGMHLPESIVPDYMHCILLGLTKSFMYKWFSPTHSGKLYFVGKELKTISKKFNHIKPPDFVERHTNDLEKNFSDMKATEYQNWLLYYGIPCLIGIQNEAILDHFSLLSEAIYILLGDNITEGKLHRAKILLDTFYQEFANIYGDGSCGLNVHNLSHLVYYVEAQGPLWAWSCFAFEDSNSMILHAVHGTGNVLKQIMRHRESLSFIRNLSTDKVNPSKWSRLQKYRECEIAGQIVSLTPNENLEKIMEHTQVKDLNELQKLFRVKVNGTLVYSSQYKRMKTKISYFILTKSSEIVKIKYFVSIKKSLEVFAVAEQMTVVKESPLSNLRGAKHIYCITQSNKVLILPVQMIQEKLFYINTGDVEYVSRCPNSHGHSVFK